jgi:Putative transposase
MRAARFESRTWAAGRVGAGEQARRDRGGQQQAATQGQSVVASARREQAIVADFDEAARQYMLQETPEEFPARQGQGEQVLKYLARYTHRVAIRNQRLLSLQDGQVTFRYKDYAASNRSNAAPAACKVRSIGYKALKIALRITR